MTFQILTRTEGNGTTTAAEFIVATQICFEVLGGILCFPGLCLLVEEQTNGRDGAFNVTSEAPCGSHPPATTRSRVVVGEHQPPSSTHLGSPSSYACSWQKNMRNKTMALLERKMDGVLDDAEAKGQIKGEGRA